MYVPGCQVRLLQSASTLESLLDSEKFDVVGLAKRLFCAEKVDEVDDGKGVRYGGSTCPGGPEKGFPADGTDNRRPGVLDPPQDTGLEAVEIGDWNPDPYRLGLPVAVEKVADVGVVAPVDCVL